MSDWILVSEKKPKGEILACDTEGNRPFVSLGIVTAVDRETGKLRCWDDRTFTGSFEEFFAGMKFINTCGDELRIPPREIVAWMPLPEPYRAEGSGEE